MFDTELKALEDYDFALKLTRKYKACFVDEILLDASYSKGGVSGNPVNYLVASCMILTRYKMIICRQIHLIIGLRLF